MIDWKAKTIRVIVYLCFYEQQQEPKLWNFGSIKFSEHHWYIYLHVLFNRACLKMSLWCEYRPKKYQTRKKDDFLWAKVRDMADFFKCKIRKIILQRGAFVWGRYHNRTIALLFVERISNILLQPQQFRNANRTYFANSNAPPIGDGLWRAVSRNNSAV